MVGRLLKASRIGKTTVLGTSEMLLRKNELRSFKLNVKYGTEYGASFDNKYGESCKILFQIRGRRRIVFVSEV